MKTKSTRFLTSRVVLSAALSLSMVLSSTPAAAIRALADEVNPEPIEGAAPEGEGAEGGGLPADAGGEGSSDVAEEGGGTGGTEEPEGGTSSDGGDNAEAMAGVSESGQSVTTRNVPLRGATDGTETDGGEDAIVEVQADGEGDPDAANQGGGALRAAIGDYATVGIDQNRVSLNGQGFTINLFNYGATDSSSNIISSPDPYGINSEDGTSSTLRPFQFYGQGSGVGSGQTPGFNNYSGGNATPIQGIVRNRLVKDSSDGNSYPVLANTTTGTSLKYLFDASSITRENAKEPHMNVDKLFKMDEYGFLTYDSNENYAVYDSATNNFKIYNGTYNKANETNYKIGFFPFNEWNASSNNTTTPGTKEHQFGLSMHGTFTMPEDSSKMVTSDSGQSRPMLFEMGGDDDMWVFIDGVLVLDLGGIHQPVQGCINFTDGTVSIIGDPLNNRMVSNDKCSVVKANDAYGKQATYTTAKRTYDDYGNLIAEASQYDVLVTSIDSMFACANLDSPDAERVVWDDSPGSSHTIDIFYLERGSYDSNLLIRMNFPITKTAEISVHKDWTRNGELDTSHSDSVFVQLYQQVLNSNGTLSEARPFRAPVELTKEGGWDYTYEDIPLRSDQGYEYFYFVQEGQLDGQDHFIPASDGWFVSEGAVYALDDITYSVTNATGDQCPSYPQTYRDTPGAAMHFVSVDGAEKGRAVISNKREGVITVEKQWVDAEGNVDNLDHSQDSVAVQLVKLTKGSAADFSDATESVIGVVELNEANRWHAGFDGNGIEEGENVRYLVREGKMVNGAFQPSDTPQVTSGNYLLDSITYTRTRYVAPSGSGTTISVAPRDTADYIAANTRGLHWAIDEYTYPSDHPYNPNVHRFWLNQHYGNGFVEIAAQDDSEPIRTSDTVTHTLYIPSTARWIPETGNSAYDFVVDISLDTTHSLSLNGVTAGSVLEGSGCTITSTGANSYRLTIPASWVRQHAGYEIDFSMAISTTGTSLQHVTAEENRAQVQVIPTDYIVSYGGGHGYSEQDSWSSHDYLQLLANGTGHGLLKNKPAVTSVTVEKVWDDTSTVSSHPSVWVQLYRDDAPVGTPAELTDGHLSYTFENLDPTGTYTAAEGVYEDIEGQTDKVFTARTLWTVGEKTYTQTSVTYYDKDDHDKNGENVAYTSLDGTIYPYSGKVVFTNAPVEADITLTKVDADSDGGADPIQGVRFKLVKDSDYQEDANPAYDATADVEVVTGGDALTTAADGTVALPTLNPGAYWLVETEAPDAYVLRDANHPVGFVFKTDGSIALVDDGHDTDKTRPTIAAGSQSGTFVLTVRNVRAYALPSAGGPGVCAFLFAGALLATLTGSEARKGSKGRGRGRHGAHAAR